MIFTKILQKVLNNKKVIGLKKDKLVGKIITNFVGLRTKIFVMDSSSEDKKQQTQKSVP